MEIDEDATFEDGFLTTVRLASPYLFRETRLTLLLRHYKRPGVLVRKLYGEVQSCGHGTRLSIIHTIPRCFLLLSLLITPHLARLFAQEEED